MKINLWRVSKRNHELKPFFARKLKTMSGKCLEWTGSQMQQVLGECPDMTCSCLEEMMRVDGQGAAPGFDRLAILSEWYQFNASLNVLYCYIKKSREMQEVSTKQQHIIHFFLTNYFVKSIVCLSENPATAMWTLHSHLCYARYFYFILTWFFIRRLKVETGTLPYTQLI